MSNQEQMPFILSLLSEATTESLTFENIIIAQDGITHLPCRNSNTWRKNHGWSDLGQTGSSHSSSAASRWGSAVVPCLTQAPKAEEACRPSPPMPPKRQTSDNSYTSSDGTSLIAQARRQSSSSSASSNCSSDSSATTQKKFNYPSALLPEGTSHTTESHRRESVSSLPCVPSVTPCKPERQASSQSLLELTTTARREQTSRNKKLHTPLSLYLAPSMPQRQDSVCDSLQSSFSTLSSIMETSPLFIQDHHHDARSGSQGEDGSTIACEKFGFLDSLL